MQPTSGASPDPFSVMKKLVGIACCILLASANAGCASLHARGDNESGNPTAFAGTRLNLAALHEDWGALSLYRSRGVRPPTRPLLDLPASFAFDVFALPDDLIGQLGRNGGNWIWAESASADKLPYIRISSTGSGFRIAHVSTRRDAMPMRPYLLASLSGLLRSGCATVRTADDAHVRSPKV